MTEDNDREKKTKNNIQTQKEIVDVAKEIKNNAKEASKVYGEVGHNIDIVTDEYGKHLQMTQLCLPYVNNLNGEQWKTFEEKMSYDYWLLDRLKNINKDVKTQVAVANEVSTVSASSRNR